MITNMQLLILYILSFDFCFPHGTNKCQPRIYGIFERISVWLCFKFLVGQFSQLLCLVKKSFLRLWVAKSAVLLHVSACCLLVTQPRPQAGLMNAQLMVCVSWRYTWRISSKPRKDSNVHNMRCLCFDRRKTSKTFVFHWIINHQIFEWIHIFSLF